MLMILYLVPVTQWFPVVTFDLQQISFPSTQKQPPSDTTRLQAQILE